MSSLILALASIGHAADWADELAALDARIAFHDARVGAHPESWLEGERLARLLHQRARLSGDYDDYSRAEAVYEDAFAGAPPGSGPLLGRARLYFTLHRLPEASADLSLLQAQPLHTTAQRAAMAELSADIALEQGDLPGALLHWQEAEASTPTMRTAASQGRIAWLRGDLEAADAWFVVALDRYHGKTWEPVAWLHLQRGLLDLEQGRPDAALAHYADADAALSGYWLVEEHIAEALALTGQTEAALHLYRDVVDRTGSPELQGALAELLVARGETAEAESLLAAAAEGHAALLERHPEAAAGHALAHALRWSDDPAVPLALAEQNARLRPGSEALALLSQARLAAGDASGALDAARQGLSRGAWSVDLLVAAAAASAALGDDLAATGFTTQARRLDPTLR